MCERERESIRVCERESVCTSEGEKERKREREKKREKKYLSMCVQS